MKVLALDTATEACSAALWLEGQLTSRCEQPVRRHGELILPMIDALLSQAGIGLRQLDAIAFGRGPGAFTGVRLAASVTQGLAFAADLPVIAVSDLRALAQGVLRREPEAQQVLVCQDARMAELYWGSFVREGEVAQPHGEERLSAAAAVQTPPGLPAGAWWGAGSGFEAQADLFAKFSPSFRGILASVRPDARDIALLAAHAGLGAARPAAQALPVYLRDQVAHVPLVI